MDGVALEVCAECGFDARRWRPYDVGSMAYALGLWWRLATEGIDATLLNTRPASGVWSVLEYGVHSALVTAVLREGAQRIVAADGVDLGPAPSAGDGGPGEPATGIDPAAVVADLEREGKALARFIPDTPDDAWTNTGGSGNATLQARAVVVHAAHDASHHFMDVGRGLSALGAGTPPQTGTVARVNASDGGVPKRAIGGAAITHDGLDGDRQADEQHHGRSFQALCLWSTEVIADLAAEGHPIEPGSAGENITLEGVDWSTIRPGTRLRIGSALAEISFPSIPCAKQTRWFSDGDFKHIAHERAPHRTRWYAWVREPGEVRMGDDVVVQP